MWNFDVDEEVQINAPSTMMWLKTKSSFKLPAVPESTVSRDVHLNSYIYPHNFPFCDSAPAIHPDLSRVSPDGELPFAQPRPERSSYSFYTRSFLRVSFPNVIARVNMMRTEFCFPDTPTPTPPGHIVDHHPDPRLRPALVLNLQGTPGKGQTNLELGADTLSLRETM